MTTTDKLTLADALEWALEWIDAVPPNTPLPAMPGFDRDAVNDALAAHRRAQSAPATVAWLWERGGDLELTLLKDGEYGKRLAGQGFIAHPLYRAPAPDALREAVEALGSMPEGYCFCSRDRIGDDSKKHEPECADIRSELNVIVWDNGSFRTKRGDLYEVLRLSENVWQVLKNGTPFPGWYSSQEFSRAAVRADLTHSPAQEGNKA